MRYSWIPNVHAIKNLRTSTYSVKPVIINAITPRYYVRPIFSVDSNNNAI